MVIRDSSSKVIGSKVIKGLPLVKVEIAEAIVVREGLQFTTSLGGHNLILESDNKRVRDNIRSPAQDFSSLGLIVDDIRNLALFSTLLCFLSLIGKLINLLII